MSFSFEFADWSAAFGRLHPLVLHLPIGLLFGLFALELWSLRPSARPERKAQALLAWLLAASAALAAWTGHTLGEEPGRGGDLLERHEELGDWVAWGSAAVAVLHALSHGGERRLWLGLYRAALVVTVVQLVRAGHLGASMTHGRDFLLEPLRGGEPAQPIAASASSSSSAAPEDVKAPSGPSYARDVAPVLQERCARCHGSEKQKGELALHTPDAIAQGGEHGPVLVAGDPAASEIVRRLRLPLEHDDHMPPEGKPQPSELEIAALESWIAAGASFDGVQLEAPAAAVPAASAVSESPPSASAAEPRAAPAEALAEPPGASAEALAALRERLVHVQPKVEGSPLLWIDFAAPAAEIDDEAARALLEPVRELVEDLALARSRVTDAIAPLLAAMPELRRLDLSSTACGDATLAALAGHARLEELVLTDTAVTDASVESLLALPALRRVYAWSSGLGADALARVRAARPELMLDFGDRSAAPVLEEEGLIVLSGDAPPVDAEAASASAALVPVNTACPVSGAPANAAFAVVFEGRVIAFCCAKCPAEFWANPEAFRAKVP